MSYITPEQKIQRKIISYLKSIDESDGNIFYIKRQAGSFSYKKGIPDIYVVYYGIHIEIEVKTEDGKLSTLQEKYKEKFEKCGAIYLVARDVNSVKNIIETIKGEFKNEKI